MQREILARVSVKDLSVYKVGQVLRPSMDHQFPVPGTVERVELTGDNNYIYVRMKCGALDGDKVVSLSGQKFVTTIVADADMPVLTVTSPADYKGETLKPDIVIAATSILKRITVGDLITGYVGFVAAKKNKQVVIGTDVVEDKSWRLRCMVE